MLRTHLTTTQEATTTTTLTKAVLWRINIFYHRVGGVCVIRVTNNIIIVMPYGGGLSPKNNNEVKCRFPLDTWSARPWTGIEWGWQSDEKCPPVHWLVVILNDLQAMMREVDAWSGSLVYSFAASSSSSSSSISATHLLTLQHFCLALIGLRRVSNGHN